MTSASFVGLALALAGCAALAFIGMVVIANIFPSGEGDEGK